MEQASSGAASAACMHVCCLLSRVSFVHLRPLLTSRLASMTPGECCWNDVNGGTAFIIAHSWTAIGAVTRCEMCRADAWVGDTWVARVCVCVCMT